MNGPTSNLRNLAGKLFFTRQSSIAGSYYDAETLKPSAL
jgi:hypothetical protein